MTIPERTLNNGIRIPQLGFGVFQIEGPGAADTIADALAAGYRHIDTAQGYRNEKEVGDAIERSGIDPADIFITSKLGNAHITSDDARRAIDGTVASLRVKRPDMFLVHWPLPTVRDYMDVWRALEEACADGVFRAIGVSNFQVSHLERLAAESDIVPVVNQIELHPYLVQSELRAYHDAHGIATEAWSPIGQGMILDDAVVGEIASKLQRTPAQVVLRWHLQLGNIVIPKSSSPARMAENLRLFNFQLSEADVEAISALNRDHRTGGDPDTFRYTW